MFYQGESLHQPVQVNLAPRTLHGALRSSSDAWNAWKRRSEAVEMVREVHFLGVGGVVGDPVVP